MRKRIWIPESLNYNPPKMQPAFGFEMGAGMAGYFMVDLIDAKSGKIKEHYEFPNLITNVGLDQVAQGAAQTTLFDYLGVGTNAGVPAFTDTALGAEVIRTDDNGEFDSLEIDGGPITGSGGALDSPYWFKRIVRFFFESEANGNLTELGWFNQAAGGTMTVRSLFKDGGGSPIVITKTSSDQLRITYETRMYPHVGNNPPDGNPNSRFSSGTVTLGPTLHEWSGSSIGIFGSEWGWHGGFGMLGASLNTYTAYAGPSGTTLLHPTASSDQIPGLVVADINTKEAYSVGSFQQNMLATWNASTANFGPGGIKVFTIRASPTTGSAPRHFQLVISESIPKTTTERVRLRFRITVNRAVTS